ncbi:MAG TPA: DUF481 domain-containing protein [Acidobacteriaceae bacterium]|nr:DUF481 domain-containing protein [Acidobacteriaceae bacterium]
MSPTQVRSRTRRFRLRWATTIAAIFVPLLLIAPPALLAAKSSKKPAKVEPKKPEGPKEILIFKNGDQITGKLLNSTGTKIKFDSEVAGEITVPLEKIKELKSDRPFAIVPKEPKGFKKRKPVVEGIIQLEAKGIIVVPITPEKEKKAATAKPSEAKPAQSTAEAKTEVPQPKPLTPAQVAKSAMAAPSTSSTAKVVPPSATSTAPTVVKTTPPVTVETGRLIPADQIGFVVDDSTYQKEITRKINWRTGWTGNITTGTTVIRATQNSYQFLTDVTLQRTIPTVIWLDPKLRTTFHYTQSAGRISQPGTVTTVTNIFHVSAERDEYFSRRGYYLQQVNFDHDTTQGLDLQQIYGAGVGVTFFKKEDSEFDVTADLHYESQAFNSTADVTALNRKLIGSMVSEAYTRKFGKITFDEKTLADFAWNDENAFSAAGNAGIRLPLYKKLSFSLAVIDNFQNDPQVGYQKNSFQFSTGLSFSLH